MGSKNEWENLCSFEEVIQYYFCGGIVDDFTDYLQNKIKENEENIKAVIEVSTGIVADIISLII